MFSFLKSGLLSLSLGSGLLLAGCQSGGAPMAATHDMSKSAVRCDKCQVTWVNLPSAPGNQGGMTGFSSVKKMECADCREAVSTFFATGNLKHECKACGSDMMVCETH